MKGPIVLQNSHLCPLFPSHESAGTKEMLFCNPGSLNCVTWMPVAVNVLYGVPPVSFRFICIGLVSVHVGQALAGLVAFGSEDAAPFATLLSMDGLPLIMKLP